MTMTRVVDEDTYVTLSLAVDAGTEFMGAIDGEWHWIVEPETLDMSVSMFHPRRECGCVLAQHNPLGRFAEVEYHYKLTVDDVYSMGFAVVRFADYSTLTDLWREAIYDRRAADLERREAKR